MTTIAPNSSTRPRMLRVFVSSTFRDMGQERDELVYRVFPQLRAICESRGITCVEVDLRWGITEQESAAEKTIGLCLDQIDACRPCFLCFLGERYGWVPERLPTDLLARQPWLADHVGASATEMEILYGALSRRSTEPGVYFYVRDTSYLNRLPSDRNRRDYESESPTAAARLAALKQRIHDTGLPVRSYHDPVAGAVLAQADLTALVEQLFPEASLEGAEREDLLQRAFAEQRAGTYVGRQAYFNRLDTHAGGSGGTPLIVSGPDGAGKSALLACWALTTGGQAPRPRLQPANLLARIADWGRRRVRGSAGDRPFVFTHFTEAAPAAADWVAMLRRTMLALKERFAVALEVPRDATGVSDAFANFLNALPAEPVILLFDGLDHLERSSITELAWLPIRVPSHVRLVVSSGPGATLDALRARGWAELQVQQLSARERDWLVQDYLGEFGKKLNTSSRETLVASSAAKAPLYLRTVLEELRVTGVHETIAAQLVDHLNARDLASLYDVALGRMEQVYERRQAGLVGRLLSLLNAARYGLSEAELADALNPGNGPVPSSELVPLLEAMRAMLVRQAGLLNFAGRTISEVARRRYLSEPEAKLRCHRLLADYFAARPQSERRDDELPWHLAAVGDWPALRDLLADLHWLVRVWRTRQAEVRTYWDVLRQAGVDMAATYVPHLRSIAGASQTMIDAALPILELLRDSGHLGSVMELLPALMDTARVSGDTDRLGAMLGMHGLLLHRLGRYTEALKAFAEEERHREKPDRIAALAACLANQAVVARALGQTKHSADLHRREETLCRRIQDCVGLAASLGNQAALARNAGDTAGAMRMLVEQERTYRLLCDQTGLHHCLGSQAVIQTDRGKFKGALKLHRQEEEICRRIGDRYGLQQSLGNRARVMEKLADYDAAIALLDEKEALCRDLNHSEGLARTYAQQAHLIGVGLGHPRQAEALATKALECAQRNGLTVLAAEARQLLDGFRAAPD